jgi:hypothetical protein
MPRGVWFCAASDPLRSGELRRLGLPALLTEAEGWSNSFLPIELVARAGKADVAILPMAAIDSLPLIAQFVSSTVLIEVDTQWIDSAPSTLAILAGLQNRIAGVVARGPRAAAWAVRAVGPEVPVWTVPDAAVRAIELKAAALHFDIGTPHPDPHDLPDSFELWFAEPGDRIDHEEVAALVRSWQPPSGQAVVVAAPETRVWLQQAGLDFKGFDWSPDRLQSALTRANRCVFFGPQTASQSRRRAMALRSGGTASRGHRSDDEVLSPTAVGRAWSFILESLRPGVVSTRERGAVLIALDLIQDLDVALPLIDAMTDRGGIDLRIVVTGWLHRRSPRVAQELADRDLKPLIFSRDALLSGTAPSLDGVGGVVSFAESSLPAHERAHALTRRARSLRIPTFSFQHGVENVGLTRLDHEDGEVPSLLSDHIFAWGPVSAGVQASRDLRPRLVHVGRLAPSPKPTAELSGALTTFRSIVAVFENLHWNRYDNAWRRRFLADCVEFAALNPERAVLIKPHHGGLWTVRNTHQFPQWPTNLVLADPTDPFWEPFTAPSILQVADLVITTPSTVALDAVQAGKRVAVAAYGLSLPAYEPLPLLNGLQDWRNFAAAEQLTDEALRRASFLMKTAAGDRPAESALDYLLTTMSERAGMRLRHAAPLEAVP